MKKRIIAFLLILSCISANTLLCVAADEPTTTVETETAEKAEPEREHLLDLSFDNITMDDLTDNDEVIVKKNQGKIGIIDYADIDPESDVGKVLSLTYDGKSMIYECFPVFSYPLKKTVKSGKVFLETDVYFATSNFLYAGFGYEEASAIQGSFASRYTAVGSLQDTTYSVLRKQWLKVKLSVDFDERLFSLYVDDAAIFDEEDLPDTVQALDSVRFGGWPAETAVAGMYIKNVKCYTEKKQAIEETQLEAPYAKQEKLLQALGIIKDTDKYSMDSLVTRGEFAQLITRSMGIEEANIDFYDGEEFKDVGPANIYKRSIGYLAQLGWIHSDDGKFYPDINITLEQASKWMCYLLGCDVIAEQRGGYPYGYMNVLSELGIIKNIELNNKSEFTLGNAFLMISRLLESDIYTPVSFGDEVILEKTEDHTAMQEYFNCHKIDGIVTATETTGIGTVQSSVGKNQIKIDEILYHSKVDLSEDLIGKRVLVYFTDDSYKEIIYLEIDSENEQLRVIDEDIIKVTDKNGNYEFEYVDDKDKTKRITLSKNAYFLYNGIAYGDVIPLSYLKPLAGEVIFTDNDGDGKYDVVSTYSYTYVAVKSLDTISNKIYGQNGEVIPLGDDFYIWDGADEVDYTTLVEWNVLKVRENLNGDIHILVLGEGIEGVVESKTKTEIVIDEGTYKISPALADDAKEQLEIGKTVAVYLDELGRICAVRPDEKGLFEVGYIMAAANGKALDAAKVKILTAKGEIEIYDLSRHFRYNNKKLSEIKTVKQIDMQNGIVSDSTEDISNLSDGDKLTKLLKTASFKKQISNRTAEDIQKNISDGYITADRVGQVVSYRTKNNNEIAAIDTESVEVSVPVDYYYGGRTYKKPGIIVKYAVVDKEAPAFIIPPEGSPDSDYKVIDWEKYPEKTGLYPEAYNMSSALLPEVLVFYGAQEEVVNDNSEPMIVESVYQTLNENDDVVYGFDVYNRGKKMSYLTEDSTVGSEVQSGDIIQFSLNDDNEIELIKVSVRAADKPDFIRDDRVNQNVQLNYGVIMGIEKSALAIATKNEGTDEEPIPTSPLPFVLESNVKVYLYDLTMEKVYIGNVNDVKNYTFALRPDVRVVTRHTMASLEDIYIFFE